MKQKIINFFNEVKRRTALTKTTRWVRFSIVTLLWLAFTVWTGAWWLLLIWFLLYDIYITHFIPFTWWKKSDKKWVRTVMSWVDAIVYALILVWFVFNFVGQNYTIPSSSLEKSLLTGDYIFVNKMVYGPRVPMTPINFPLVHNTMPLLNCKSYLEWPSIGYKRLAGLRDVELGDIVVFNFPAGDTIMTRVQNPDYYQLCRLYGYNRVNNDPQFGEKITRPVDRRENYVKRCVGLPGQSLKIVDGDIYLDGEKQPMPRNAQFRYLVQASSRLSENLLDEIGLSLEDRNFFRYAGSAPAEFYESVGIAPLDSVTGAIGYIYEFPLTSDMVSALRADSRVKAVVRCPAYLEDYGLFPFALSDEQGWTRADYGGSDGILIPKKGMTVKLDRDNWILYERCIRVYEGHSDARWENGRAYIGGKPADTYTFGMDYYFMMGDNRDNSLDSRYWGFVPEDHVVGTPVAVLASFDKDKSIFGGKIRFNRIFRNPNPDKSSFTQPQMTAGE